MSGNIKLTTPASFCYFKDNMGDITVRTYLPRFLKLNPLLQQKSYFLFGPRQTGKTQLINAEFSLYKTYNLLHSETFRRFAFAPERLREEVTAEDKIIIIDEIQLLPILLNEVHALLEEKNIHFLLTGSNARKLRSGGVNLLGGRARSRHLHPFVFAELPQFDLKKAINYGTIPSIWFSDAPEEDLSAYIGQYLQLEILAEGAVRNIPAFSRFLEIAALNNAKMINFTNIANDAQVSRTTVHEYFSILKDTLIATEIPAWGKTKKRKPVSTNKFYFFDTGIVRILQGRNILHEGTPEFGEAFESYIFHEIKSYIDYCQPTLTIHHWRSVSHFEVDFIVADAIAFEIKAKKNVTGQDLKGIQALAEEKLCQRYVLVSLEQKPRKVGNIEILPLIDFLQRLWQKDFF